MNRIWAVVWLAATAIGVFAGVAVLGPALVHILK